MRYKDGVPRNSPPSEQIQKARFIYEDCLAAEFDQEQGIITGTNEKGHLKTGKHYTLPREAEDYRFPEAFRRFLNWLRAKLGPDYDVVVEKDHIHIEYDPKKR